MSENNTIAILNEYIEGAKVTNDSAALKELNCKFRLLVPGTEDDEELEHLRKNVYAVVSEVVYLREELKKADLRNKSVLTETEHAEILKVQQLIDCNLFTYHFQPIVRADTGDIYSYEALMRAGDMQGITPFHILKYAELTDRLDEVEQYTFLNVLGFIDKHRELFEDRPVFINSMPSTRVASESSAEIERMLERLSDMVVVEMTENSEFNDDELNEIKKKYSRLGVRIAIDDYGTGYSNISNLLRYKPNYVKIDRTLLSGIENNPNKKHFVREIIDFCHENDILALAEGVESTEELRTVILLGVDLIQGFYTARPSSEIIQALPYDLRTEIRSHRQERDDGKRMKIYSAQDGERVALDKLNREGYDRIIIGNGYLEGNVAVTGSQYLETNIHIETVESFRGTICLDSAVLSNIPGRPCIDIGSDSSVTIILCGSNKLENGGIRVPASSKLCMRGKGSLDISLGGASYFGIGNDLRSPHGELLFEQDGTISITADSHDGVCIGSGLGGTIRVARGRYLLRAEGSMNVCMGAFSGTANIDIIGCDFDGFASGARSTVIGSLEGEASINVRYSSIKCESHSLHTAALGTLDGKSAAINAESVSINITTSAEFLTTFGALEYDSDIRLERSAIRLKCEGANALLFGGMSGRTFLTAADIDLSAELSTQYEDCFIPETSDITVSGGKYRINVNGVVREELTASPD
ncbi:MAG: EAL domain-containing protein [Ruminiclostridium sp.]|nr:EAL domain-containing protein [Ruminiclostridium sp.]